MLMVIKMIMAMSINGRITNGGDPIPSSWTSQEEHAHFSAAVNGCEVMIVGRNTYDLDPDYFASLPVKIAVMTGDVTPETLQSLPHNVRFFSKSPQDVIAELLHNRVNRVLIAGGSGINRSFLEADLVDHLHLTVEPLIFGHGLPFVAEGDFTVRMKLEQVKMANPSGTLFLTYKRLPNVPRP